MSIEKSQLISASQRFFSGTLLSRITGMMRDMALAFYFGSTPLLASFMVAYRFANLLRRLLGEGSLQAGFIPHFTSLKEKDPKAAAFFFRDALFSLALFLSVLIFVGGSLLSFSLPLFSENFQEILLLSKIMLPGLLFICLYAFSSAHLQCERRFFLSGAAPAAFNIVWIAAAFLVHDRDIAFAMRGLAWGVVAAFFFQWVIPMGASVRHLKPHLSFRKWLSPTLFSTQVKALAKPLSLTVLGVGAMQINAALDAVFAKAADPSGPAYLWYAIRIEQLPLALFGIALANALLPSLSRLSQAGDWEEFKKQIDFALRTAFVFMLGASGALIALGSSGINLLFGRGMFTDASVMKTLFCLWGYAGSLLPSACVLFLASGFYARKEYFLPVLSSILSVLANLALNALFVFGWGWGSFSIAVATSVSTWFNALFLAYFLARKVPGLFSPRLMAHAGKITLAVAASVFLSLFAEYISLQGGAISFLQGKEGAFPKQLMSQIGSFLLPCGIYTGSFLVFAYLLKLKEVFLFLRFRKRKAPAVKADA